MTNPIPQEALLQHIAVLGKTGSGKTSTAKLIVEQLVADGDRVCILDPIKSDWWGLTSSADGKSEGLPFHILGGPRGHVPLHSSAGKAIGEIVASGALPLSIIDMADFEAGGLQRFFVDFAPALLRKMRGVLYLVIEEGHEFAPKEKAGIGDENMAIYWAKKLATAGRSKGIRMIVATQRTQALHNAILGSCDTMIMHRLTAPADQEPVKKWLKANVDKETMVSVESSLASLPTGTAWICSGEAKMFEQVTFPRIETFDNTATPTKGSGVQKVKTAQVDQDKLRAIIGDAVKEAEANDPEKLRVEIAKLKKELAAKPALAVPTIDPKAVEEAEKRGYERARADTWPEAFAEGWEKCAEEFHAAALGMMQPGEAAKRMDKVPAPVARPKPVSPKPAPRAEAPKPAPVTKHQPSGQPSKLPPGERAVLIAAVQYGGVDRDQLSVLTGYKRSSRDAYIARLREKGLVEVSGPTIAPTDAARDALGDDYQPLPTGYALQEYWMARLPEGEKRVLACLIDCYPNEVERTAIDQATGYKRSSRDAYIARLKSRRLVTTDSGGVTAASTLF